ncbi:hypothetical protein B7486_54270 [cyanobacterium TDX16]|nr:hypothetical protein B7486_54270 [cyanobacterium TDX16]
MMSLAACRVEAWEVESFLADSGFPLGLCSIDAGLEELRAWGEIPFYLFVARLERTLPRPFPDRLVEVDMTVDDLLRFRDVIWGQEDGERR